MIHKLILKNFKRIEEEAFELHNFNLIVGANNSGKSTILQALAIWQYCINQFELSKRRKGRTGMQVILPDFTALPVPKFNLLWKDKTSKRRDQKPIYIEIDVYWKDKKNEECNFCVLMRYDSPQAAYVTPKDGWANFLEKKEKEKSTFPEVVYVPPFSGLEPRESWMAEGDVRQKIGKAQPGSVLRNLLYRVIDREDVPAEENEDWTEIAKRVKEWFNIELRPPVYEKVGGVDIKSEYKRPKRKGSKHKGDRKSFDIISGGSGFHQILTLMAFVYGYPKVTTILFDEPDAHLHANLQRKIVNYFKTKSNKQFLIATHSEEFIKGAEMDSILSILSGSPKRISSANEILKALSDVDNNDVTRCQQSPFILYLEGEDDERLLSVWAKKLGKQGVYERFYPYLLGGPDKGKMKEKADQHFVALKRIVPNVTRAILLDQDGEENAINPPKEQSNLNEWKRKNIDNYLLVPNAWKRAVAKELNYKPNDLFLDPYNRLIDEHFESQNLTLPPNATWKNVQADIFKVLDGKKLLFENDDSLFNKIKIKSQGALRLNRTIIAGSMNPDEIHEDIAAFFENLEKLCQQQPTT